MGEKKGKKPTNNSKKNSTDKEKTKRIDTPKEGKKPKTKNKKQRKHPKLILFLKIMFILIVVLAIIGAGIVAGVFFGWFGNEIEISKENLMIKTSNSVVLDKEGKIITTLNGEENREVVSLDEMSEFLPKAFIAIEDERFEEHQGVDIKRTLSATFNYLVKRNTSYGGSTITQQLIKNATKEDEKDWTRKVKEIVRAFKIERVMTKNEILETYLNTIPLGGGGKNVYGVQVAAKFYFNKNAKDLNLAESAYIAGITHAPNVYNPFKESPSTDKIKTRTKTVLGKMKQLGKINEEQYTEAKEQVENGLNFNQGSVITTNNLSWFVEAAISQIIDQMVEEKGITRDVARTQLYSGGYTIYTTQYTGMQDILEEEFKKQQYVSNSKKNEGATLQAAMAIIDQSNGQVLAIVGGIGDKIAYGYNRAITSSRSQPGSAIKPIGTLAPGLQEGIITAASVFDDIPFSQGGYNPHNSYSGYKGLSNMRYMIRISQNVSQVRLMQKLTPQKSLEYMVKMGLKSLKNEQPSLPLILGGTDAGVTPVEMASAYATIANGGEYIEPTFYTKVTDTEGNVVYEAKQERNRVLSEQNAYIAQTILKEPVYGAGGTGTACKIAGQEVRGKTGTSNEYFDKWFCGFTGHYTAATWFGFDKAETIASNHRKDANTAWTNVMKRIHEGLPNKGYNEPSGIVSGNVCMDSGLLATDICRSDPRGSRAYSEIFAKGTVPTQTCTTHIKVKVCTETGKIANEFCPNVEEKNFITRPDSENNKAWQSAGDAQYMAPTETCTTHSKAPDKTAPIITLDPAKDNVVLQVNDKYTLPKATAKDDEDGDVTKDIKVEIKKDNKVVDKIDTTKEGKYIITYEVSDKAGNKATKQVSVTIKKKENNNDNTVNNNTINNTTNTTGNTTGNTIGNTTNTTGNTTNTTGSKKPNTTNTTNKNDKKKQ